MNRKFLTESLPIFILPYCILASTAGSASGHSLGNGLESDTDSLRQPTKAGIVLKDVVVEGNGYSKDMQMRSALSTTYVGKQFIETNFSGSLMQSLEKIPGVKAMSVGSNESKPTIRGLGFNRVVVAENGIKHEGQQWGDDHGLEIDQYDIDHAEVIKGPASLSYGSDAIGGVINLTSTAVPQDRFKWSANLFARSVNDAIGTSVRLTGRKNNFWYKANATFIDYADQRVPVDSIQYYSYYIKLHNRRLRNTSGRETDGSLTIGHTGNKWSSWLRISDVNTKSGFFANAHGLEVRLSEIDYDRRPATSTCRSTVSIICLSRTTPNGIGKEAWRKATSAGKTTTSASSPSQCHTDTCPSPTAHLNTVSTRTQSQPRPTSSRQSAQTLSKEESTQNISTTAVEAGALYCQILSCCNSAYFCLTILPSTTTSSSAPAYASITEA